MDLANVNNWSIVLDVHKVATRTPRPIGGYRYSPIENVSFTLASPICLIDCRTTYPNEIEAISGEDEALGCILTAYLKIKNAKSKIHFQYCGLNVHTYVSIPYFGVLPYEIRLSFPCRLENVDVIAWQYTDQSGKYDPANQSAILSAIEVVEQRANEIANKVEQIIVLESQDVFDIDVR